MSTATEFWSAWRRDIGASGGANFPHCRDEHRPCPGAAHCGRSGRELIRGGVLALPSPTRLQAIALAVHLENVDVVGEPVEQRAGQPFGAEDARPLVERQVAGDQDRAALVTPAEDLEQQQPT